MNLKGALDLESIAPCTSVPSRPAPSPPKEACGYIRPVKKLTLIPYVVLLMQKKEKEKFMPFCGRIPCQLLIKQ